MKLTIIKKANGPLTKEISYLNDQIVKDSSECYLNNGTATTVDTTLERLGSGLRNININQALVHGVCDYDKVAIVSERKFTGQDNTITRTKKNFHFVAGEGSAFFDHDPQAGYKTYSRESFLQTVAQVFPDIDKMATIWTPSTSSCIYKGNEQIVGEKGGMHIYFAVTNATDLTRFSDVLFKRLWLAGHGYIFITKDGKQLERTIFDKAVFSPERLDFVAGAICKDGLEQRLPDPIYTPGNVLDTSLLEDLIQQEETAYQQTVAEAKEKTAQEAMAGRVNYIESGVKKLVEKGQTEKAAKKIIEQRIGGDIVPGDSLFFDRLGEVKVEDVLKDPQKYDRETLRDPLEPEYGQHKGIFYTNKKDNKPVIHSQAHGGRTFFLKETDQEWPIPLPLITRNLAAPYPVALGACSALSVVATVIQGLVDIRRANKLEGPTGLYFLAIGDSGERKSTVDGFFSKPLQEWEAEQEELAKPDKQRYKAEKESWKAKKSGFLSAIKESAKKGKTTKDLEEKLITIEQEKPLEPKTPKITFDDTTPEEMANRLAHEWPVGAVLSSEAGTVLGGHAMGKDSAMRNMSMLNKLWSCESLSIDRKTQPSFTVRSARLTMGLAVQPGTISSFLDSSNGLARGVGWLARFLIAWPVSTQGERPFKEAPETWPELARFHHNLRTLLELPLDFNERGELHPQTIGLSPEAKEIWITFYNDVEAELKPGRDMADAKDVASKAADNAARLAANFQIFEHGMSSTVKKEYMQSAAAIVGWHLYEARRFMGEIALPVELDNANKLDEWLIRFCKDNNVNSIVTNDYSGPHK